ncbi:2-phosphosulfolactate phosphatase [Nocardioides bruguierae]|uniref:Probable 2-phosphosulfolactate phosphatase n=1 Tax=Nocardioides bruguierae TaxID=2945102 RepID=A0A9X2IGQ9_9ACTN|nr:2-phosphosulfolactate phosphatase [Nocardioides bruguierae]MCM0621040.1 2-phosphosulfolactate phosphatase [Nocardioides bruguierae]
MTSVQHAHGQAASQVRLAWGLSGALACTARRGRQEHGQPVQGRDDGLAVVVDVLSFTTSVGLAVAGGTEVVPCPWRDERAADLASEHQAVPAVGRSESAAGGVSLSPASVADAAAAGDLPARLLLPSPNGSTIATRLAEAGVQVWAASLRTARAVADALVPEVLAGREVTLVAAGEHWPDGSLRPAEEDLWGAGAVLAAVAAELGTGRFSPEALSARATWVALGGRADHAGHAAALLHGCASGGELVARGFGRDVDLAAQVDRDAVVPVLDRATGRFRRR